MPPTRNKGRAVGPLARGAGSNGSKQDTALRVAHATHGLAKSAPTVTRAEHRNADTPGYTAHDLKPLDFRDFLDGRRVQMAATDTKHIGFNKRQQGDFRSVKDKETYDKSPDKNTVVLEEQLIQVAESRMDYEMMTNLYKKHLGMLKLALRKPGG